jgi:hypothetical protein
MLALLALFAQDYILRDVQTSAVASYGAFKLEREDCVKRTPEVAVLHYSHCFPKARLKWSSEDGRVFITYEDNGELLLRTLSYPIHPEAPESCGAGNFHTAYRPRSATDAEWQKSAKAFREALTRCSALTPMQIGSYEAEFTEAAPHYGEAASGFRSLALAMFSNLRRCTRQKWTSRYNGRTVCTRVEGPTPNRS